MRSDHLSKHLKTHQAKKVTQVAQSDETAATAGVPASTGNASEITAIDESELAINEGEEDGEVIAGSM